MATKLKETVTIANGATTSGVVSNMGATATGVILPAAFTGVALTFEVSDIRNGTFAGLNNDAGAISITVAAGKAYILPDALHAFPYFKIVSGAAEGAARSIIVQRVLQS